MYTDRKEDTLMITGYTRPLYILPFDHRASYVSGLFGWKEPLNVEQMVTVADSKHVIYEGFQQAIADQVPQDHAGILVDEEFGSAILRDAARDRKSTRLNSSHQITSYAAFSLKKKKH